MSLCQLNAIIYSGLCCSICFVIAFVYRRNGAKYKIAPSLIAFGIAAITGAEWLSVTSSVLLNSEWPHVTPISNLCLAVVLAIIVRAKGNVSLVIDCMLAIWKSLQSADPKDKAV